MLKAIIKRLKSQKGAMETVLVALFLVIIGVGALVGFSSWINGEKNSLEETSSARVESVLDDLVAP